MGYRIRYARIGNAEPWYTLERGEGEGTEICHSVYEVRMATGRPLKSVRIACKEARECGVSEFLL